MERGRKSSRSPRRCLLFTYSHLEYVVTVLLLILSAKSCFPTDRSQLSHSLFPVYLLHDFVTHSPVLFSPSFSACRSCLYFSRSHYLLRRFMQSFKLRCLAKLLAPWTNHHVIAPSLYFVFFVSVSRIIPITLSCVCRRWPDRFPDASGSGREE